MCDYKFQYFSRIIQQHNRPMLRDSEKNDLSLTRRLKTKIENSRYAWLSSKKIPKQQLDIKHNIYIF
jgi:hypothetical protein